MLTDGRRAFMPSEGFYLSRLFTGLLPFTYTAAGYWDRNSESERIGGVGGQSREPGVQDEGRGRN